MPMANKGFRNDNRSIFVVLKNLVETRVLFDLIERQSLKNENFGVVVRGGGVGSGVKNENFFTPDPTPL